MYAPVCTRFLTYDVKLDSRCAGYCETIIQLAGARWNGPKRPKLEPDELEELDVEF